MFDIDVIKKQKQKNVKPLTEKIILNVTETNFDLTLLEKIRKCCVRYNAVSCVCIQCVFGRNAHYDFVSRPV